MVFVFWYNRLRSLFRGVEMESKEINFMFFGSFPSTVAWWKELLFLALDWIVLLVILAFIGIGGLASLFAYIAFAVDPLYEWFVRIGAMHWHPAFQGLAQGCIELFLPWVAGALGALLCLCAVICSGVLFQYVQNRIREKMLLVR